MGGYYFRQLLPAVLLPIGVLTVSNVLLPSYDYWQVQLAVYAMMLLPLALGRLARGAEGWQQAKHFALCSFVPATAFFVVTNFVHWACTPAVREDDRRPAELLLDGRPVLPLDARRRCVLPWHVGGMPVDLKFAGNVDRYSQGCVDRGLFEIDFVILGHGGSRLPTRDQGID